VNGGAFIHYTSQIWSVFFSQHNSRLCRRR
jgi:hypothetical protein